MNHKDLGNGGNDDDDDDDVFPMRTAHANETIKVPSGRQAEQIKELIDIAHKNRPDFEDHEFSTH